MPNKTALLKMLEDVAGTDEVIRNHELELFDSQVLDSMRVVELIVRLDEDFSIAISPAEFDREAWATPDKFVQDVEARIAENA
jgi:D-alanine--poly(phosphoribitol) ligase subunit 2